MHLNHSSMVDKYSNLVKHEMTQPLNPGKSVENVFLKVSSLFHFRRAKTRFDFWLFQE